MPYPMEAHNFACKFLRIEGCALATVGTLVRTELDAQSFAPSLAATRPPRKGVMPMLVILVLAVPAFMAVAMAAGLVIVTVLVHREDRHMSLRLRPVSRIEAAARRLLGVGVRQPAEDEAPTAPAGRR